MVTIDLKDAYYSVKIDGDDTLFLKILCKSKLLKFVILPNRLPPGPRKFQSKFLNLALEYLFQTRNRSI